MLPLGRVGNMLRVGVPRKPTSQIPVYLTLFMQIRTGTDLLIFWSLDMQSGAAGEPPLSSILNPRRNMASNRLRKR